MPTNTFGKIRATNHAARDFLVVPEFLMETLIQSSGFFGIGLGGYSQLAGRDYDRFGIGWYYTGLSDEVCPVLSALLDDGQGVEMFYDIAVSKDLRLTLDLQIVDPNAVATDWALVPGIRIRIEFSYLVRQLSKLHAAFPPPASWAMSSDSFVGRSCSLRDSSTPRTSATASGSTGLGSSCAR